MTRPSYIAHEVTGAPEDIALLRRFHDEVYRAQFPDRNEQESVENMEEYLHRKAEGWYLNNNYHILLYLDAGAPVAGSIVDYLCDANTGVIEFLVVSPSHRRSGIGRRLLQWSEDALNEDSRRAGHGGWAYLIAEMNDPFKSHDLADSMDPFERSVVWHRWGFHKIRFPYVQPSLSPDKQPVRNLLLMCKPAPSRASDTMPARTLQDAVYGYARWAMRIDDPGANEECQQMARHLAGKDEIGLIPLGTYVGAANGHRLALTDIAAHGRGELDAVLDIYAREFGAGPTCIPRDLFAQFVTGPRDEARFDYHLFSIRLPSESSPRGMASFFTLPGAGFGGYIAFDPSIRGQGYLADVVTAIERTMVADHRGARGWYGECEPSSRAVPVFRKQGFHELDVIYRQPPLHGQSPYAFADAPTLRLIYKEFGENFEPPRLTVEHFLRSLCWIYQVVYRISVPQATDYYRDLETQLRRTELVPWK